MDISFNISECGTTLDFTVLIPSFMSDPIELHKFWIGRLSKFPDGIDKYHPVIIGFERFLKFFRKRKLDKISSAAYIPLPFEVETHLQTKTRLSLVNGSCNILYVTMRCKLEKYNNQAADVVYQEVESNEHREIGPTAGEF